MRASRSTVVLALAVSSATHLAAVSVLDALPAREVTYEASWVSEEDAPVRADPPVASHALVPPPAPEHAPPPSIGAAPTAQNLDAPREGGADDDGAREVITLVSRVDTMTLTSTVTNAAEANQIQRIRTARDRATPWQGRATPNPEEAPFLASGEGTRRERRTPDPRDAAEGARSPAPRSAAGERAGGAQTTADWAAPTSRAGTTSAAGRETASAGAGVSLGSGRVVTTRADVAHARPALDRGPPTLHAPTIYELPRDTVDSEALTARLSQSFVDTSRRAAAREGEGAGGGSGRDDAGRSAPVAPGPGRDGTLDLSSARYRTFYLALRREVERNLSFPRERAVRLDQGHAVFRITLRRDGSLARAPELVRSTGFDDLDAASRRAIERARFEAVPSELQPGAPTVTIRLAIESRNPVAR